MPSVAISRNQACNQTLHIARREMHSGTIRRANSRHDVLRMKVVAAVKINERPPRALFGLEDAAHAAHRMTPKGDPVIVDAVEPHGRAHLMREAIRCHRR